MSIITISRGSYSRGKDVAEKVAQALGYECISRDVLIEASEQFNIPEIKLVRAIHDAPSLLDRFGHGRERYVAYFRAALLKHVQKDHVVYHGLAGHFFLMGIPHVLKVRIIADIEDRIREEMKRENISSEMARFILKKDDPPRHEFGIVLPVALTDEQQEIVNNISGRRQEIVFNKIGFELIKYGVMHYIDYRQPITVNIIKEMQFESFRSSTIIEDLVYLRNAAEIVTHICALELEGEFRGEQ